MFLEVTGNKYNYGTCQKSVLTRISTKMDVDIPVYRDVSRLFNFMYYTGVSIYFPYSADEGDSVLSRLLRILKCAVCFSIFLLLVSMTAFEIYQFTLLIWAMKNIGEIIPKHYLADVVSLGCYGTGLLYGNHSFDYLKHLYSRIFC